MDPEHFFDQQRKHIDDHFILHKKRYAAAGRVLFLLLTGGLFVFALSTVLLWTSPTERFPSQALVSIEAGSSLADVAEILTDKGIVQSELQLKTFVILQGGARAVQAGEYYFENPEDAWTIAARLIEGDLGLDPIRVTVLEGMTTYQMAEVLAEKLTRFDAVTFLERTREREGYLYPDTYYFLPNATIEDVVTSMEENFFKQIATIQDEIDAFGKPLHEVVTMASLLEREANTHESRQVVAGILWNRLEINMPLQVDAVFGYIYERETFHPKYSDLKVDSPYNTYLYKGLPPGPIASPSLSSLEAAVTPIPNDYLFYLTGRDGLMRYSQTYAQHMHNKRVYLD